MSIDEIRAVLDILFMLAVLGFIFGTLRLSRAIVDRIGEIEREVEELRGDNADTWWRGDES